MPATYTFCVRGAPEGGYLVTYDAPQAEPVDGLVGIISRIKTLPVEVLQEPLAYEGLDAEAIKLLEGVRRNYLHELLNPPQR